MQDFYGAIDIRCREGEPRVARFHSAVPFITPKIYYEPVYIIVGTNYGYIHTAGGDIRTWETASGAYRFLKQYEPF